MIPLFGYMLGIYFTVRLVDIVFTSKDRIVQILAALASFIMVGLMIAIHSSAKEISDSLKLLNY